jgi:hypothetical protein
MAQKKDPDSAALNQLNPSSSGEAGPQTSAAAKLKQFDPKAPRRARRTAVAQSLPTFDTLLPEDDWFQARDELLRRFPDPLQKGIVPQSTNPLQRIPRILGIGVGLKYTEGSLTGDLCVKIFVSDKVRESELSSSDLIPKEVAGKITDVEQVSRPVLHAADARYDRPVLCGVSVGLADVFEIGTIGVLVATKSNDLCILSNNHVLANSNGDANPGASQLGQQVLQPGQMTRRPMPNDVIGELHDFVPLRSNASNLVDAALALTSFGLVSPRHVTYTLNPDPVQAALGMTVMKNGMMTGSTIGIITDIGVGRLQVPYTGLGTIFFDNQIVVRGVSGGPFSSAGDSGSLIVTLATKQPVALLFAGGQDQSGFVTYANLIGDVMDALDIDRFIVSTDG